jgi:hypothetical protein
VRQVAQRAVSQNIDYFSVPRRMAKFAEAGPPLQTSGDLAPIAMALALGEPPHAPRAIAIHAVDRACRPSLLNISLLYN